MKQLIGKISRAILGPSEQERAEWLERKFIPAFRRMIDAIDGRCTVPRAKRTVEALKEEGKAFFPGLPASFQRSFAELENVLNGHVSHERTSQIREQAEDCLDIFFAERNEKKALALIKG